MSGDWPGEKPDPKTATRFRAEATTLVRYAPNRSETFTATRIGSPDAGGSPIVGSWRYRHPTGAIAFEHYTPDGRVAFRLPMKATVGCYDVDPVTRT